MTRDNKKILDNNTRQRPEETVLIEKCNFLEAKNRELLKYIRAKTDRLLQVMGTVPLHHEELDDNTLLSVDPIGIVAESFVQVLEHLNTTNDELTSIRNELQAVLDSAGAGIVVVNTNMEVEACNTYSMTTLFSEEEQVLGNNLRGVLCESSDKKCIMEEMLLTGRRVEKNDFVHNERHYQLVGTPLKSTGGEINRFVLIYTDITERRNAAIEIERLAFYDSLTGLPNRVLLKEHLSQMLARARRNKEIVALLFIDLDHFKEVNDTLGHIYGDQLLQVVAERLSSCLRSTDSVARFGGDEFVVLLEGVPDREGILEVANKLLAALSHPVQLGDREIYTGGSIGISQFPEDGEDVDTLFKNADTAMYYAKDAGRNVYRFYSSEMHTSALELLTLSGFLRHSLERSELFILYQPQISFITGTIVGVEALLRWRHPFLGMIPPDRFIPMAEETGLIIEIGSWVLKMACVDAVSWLDKGLPPLRVSVNISAKQFRDQGLVGVIQKTLKETGLPPHLLELELTEGMLIENISTTRNTLDALKKMGVTLAIDDFGTGYSSLSYLKHFPLDRLKIDKSFVQEITEVSGDSAAIVEAIIALAHSLKLTVIAEGVEEREQVEFLKERNCDELQGYYFSRPLKRSHLEHLLRKSIQEPKFCLFNYR